MVYGDKIQEMIDSAEFMFDEAESLLSIGTEAEREQLENVKGYSLKMAHQLRRLRNAIPEDRLKIDL